MLNEELVKNLQDLISSAQSILVVVSPKADHDQWSAATAVYSSLRAAGKDISLCSPVVPDFSLAVEQNEVRTNMGNQNLVVSFDYSETSVDKVSYHIGEESKKFYLTVKPKKGYKPLDTSSVEFSYSGVETDLAILVGVHDLESLDTLYYGYETLYQNTPLISLHTFDPGLGGIVFDVSGQVCMSEAVCLLIESLQMSYDQACATELLYAIEEKTDHFRSLTTTAETFEIVSRLLRGGARRLSHAKTEQSKNIYSPTEQETVLLAENPQLSPSEQLLEDVQELGNLSMDQSGNGFAQKLEKLTSQDKLAKNKKSRQTKADV